MTNIKGGTTTGAGQLEPFKNAEIVTTCKAGERAHTAAKILMRAGFRNMRGGDLEPVEHVHYFHKLFEKEVPVR